MRIPDWILCLFGIRKRTTLQGTTPSGAEWKVTISTSPEDHEMAITKTKEHLEGWIGGEINW